MAIEGMFFDAIESGGTYDREYSSGDFSRYLELIVGNGVFPNPSTQLQVRADSGLNIIVGQGQGWIDGHKLLNTADLPMTLDPADALLNRIDRVIFYCDYTAREVADELSAACSAEVCGVIGRKIILYRESIKNKKIEL